MHSIYLYFPKIQDPFFLDKIETGNKILKNNNVSNKLFLITTKNMSAVFSCKSRCCGMEIFCKWSSEKNNCNKRKCRNMDAVGTSHGFVGSYQASEGSL